MYCATWLRNLYDASFILGNFDATWLGNLYDAFFGLGNFDRI
jgi:hypothetical protein